MIFSFLQKNKINLLHLIVAPQQSGGRQHYRSTKTRQAVCADEQSIYSCMSMELTIDIILKK
jgi:hypothetical protein